MADKRRRVNKACVFCHRSHLMCDQERPCGRCVKRQISDMCRDAETELHTLYRKHMLEAKSFYEDIRSQRNGTGLLNNLNNMSVLTGGLLDSSSTTSSAVLYSSDDQKDQTGGRWLAYLDEGDVMTQPLPGNGQGEQPLFSIQNATTKDDSPLLRAVLEKRGAVNVNKRVLALLRYHIGTDEIAIFMRRNVPARAEELSIRLAQHDKELVDALAACDERELVELTQELESKILHVRKFLSNLGIPALVWRRTGKLCVVTDNMAELLGYRKEELLGGGKHIHDMVARDEVITLMVDATLPLLVRNCKQDSAVFSTNILRKDGISLPARCTLRILFGLRNIPLISVMCVVPLLQLISYQRRPAMEINPSLFSIALARDAASTYGQMILPLYSSTDPAAGVSASEISSILAWI